jgi:hypothetical protein
VRAYIAEGEKCAWILRYSTGKTPNPPPTVPKRRLKMMEFRKGFWEKMVRRETGSAEADFSS